MYITIEFNHDSTYERNAVVQIAATELAAVHLHMAYPEGRNRTDRYMRRHSMAGARLDTATPNCPYRSPDEPAKLTIPSHIEEMRRSGVISSPEVARMDGRQTFCTERAMLAVPISDLTSNLLRPCLHRDGLGGHRLFHFDGEPIDERDYYCACFFTRSDGRAHFDIRRVHFDRAMDRAVDEAGSDLLDEGLVWSAAIVPLVVNGEPLGTVDIAQHDYDLRHLLGRSPSRHMRYAYDGWFGEWEHRVTEVVSEHARSGRPFAEFYHSILGIDDTGGIQIVQMAGTLPTLARMLAQSGLSCAGVLDSGGSCALYDVWMSSYLNHGWYYREPRGSILVFELTTLHRVPRADMGSWVDGRKA